MIVRHCVNSAMNTIEIWSIPRPPGTDVIEIVKHNHKEKKWRLSMSCGVWKWVG